MGVGWSKRAGLPAFSEPLIPSLLSTYSHSISHPIPHMIPIITMTVIPPSILPTPLFPCLPLFFYPLSTHISPQPQPTPHCKCASIPPYPCSAQPCPSLPLPPHIPPHLQSTPHLPNLYPILTLLTASDQPNVPLSLHTHNCSLPMPTHTNPYFYLLICLPLHIPSTLHSYL